jgi:outer membrane receptor for ferrienterochelin and colicins
MRDPAGSFAIVLLLLGCALPLGAQTGTVLGTVTDLETGGPLSDVAIQVLGLDERQARGVYSNALGQYRLTLPPGTYALVFRLLGRETRRVDGVRVQAGETHWAHVSLRAFAEKMNPVVVVGSRREEKALEAMAHVEVVGARIIRERAAVTPVEHVKAVPGLDIVQTGITQGNVVARGFNNVFSGALLVMTDHRHAHVPSLRFNAHNMIPVTDLDVDRMEVSLGPGAALYGPNSAGGILHIVTTSPLDSRGTSVFLTSGFRSGNTDDPDAGGVFQAGGRSSFLLDPTLGVRVSGQYVRANDWNYSDPLETASRLLTDSAAVGGHAWNRMGNRDFLSERYGGELRMDYRPSEDTEVILAGGYNLLARSIELTGMGAGLARNWSYRYLQSRLRTGRLFTQVFWNQSNAGDTYLLRTGQPVVDESYMVAGQVQHGLDLGHRQSFLYGLDLQRTEPRTGGTITGGNEDDDIVDEIGGYVHSRTRLGDRLDMVTALRVDRHNRLPDLVLSPRAALAFRPTPTQTLRLAYNRAFSTPTTNNLFLDMVALENLGGLGYDIRTVGVPSTGLSFRERCGTGYCMYSPFAPGAKLPSTFPGSLWNGLLSLVAAQRPELAPYVPFLQSPNPSIATYLRRFNQEEAGAEGDSFILDPGPAPILPLRPTITNHFELGYSGLLAGRLLVAAQAYHARIQDFVGPLRTETPSVFMDPVTLGAYVRERLTPLVQAGALTPTELDALMETFVGTWQRPGLAQVPIGTIAPDQRSDPDLLLTFRNFGNVELWGADLSAQLLLNEKLSFRGSASWVSRECFLSGSPSCSGPEAVALNAPTFKGSFSTRWEDAATGVSLEGRFRYVDGFPMNSGVFVGRVNAYSVLDANGAYRPAGLPGVTVSVTGTNLLNRLHREFVGAPELGRLLLIRLQYDF